METEADVYFSKVIRPSQFLREIYNYRSPRKQVCYYFDGSGSGKEQNKV